WISRAEYNAQANSAFSGDTILGVAITAGPGGGDPFPYVIYEYFKLNSLTYVQTSATFNNGFAFAYAGCAPNSHGYVGCSMSWGGGTGTSTSSRAGSSSSRTTSARPSRGRSALTSTAPATRARGVITRFPSRSSRTSGRGSPPSGRSTAAEP